MNRGEGCIDEAVDCTSSSDVTGQSRQVLCVSGCLVNISRIPLPLTFVSNHPPSQTQVIPARSPHSLPENKTDEGLNSDRAGEENKQLHK